MKRIYTLIIALLVITTGIWAQTTRTWVGPATGGSWTVAGNWSGGVVPVNNNIVVIDAGVSGTISAVPSITLGGLRIEGNSTVTFNVTGDRTINISGNGSATPRFLIEAGSTLILDGGGNDIDLDLNRTAGPGNVLADISGTLVLGNNTTLDWNNGNTVATVSGSIENIDGTFQLVAGSLVFANGGVYSHQRNGNTIPTATWNTGSKAELPGITTTLPGGLNQTFATLEFNGPITANLEIGSNISVSEDLIISLNPPGGVHLRLTNSNTDRTITVGRNFIMNSGTFSLDDNNGGSSLLIAGNYLQSGGTLTETSTGPTTVIFNGTGVQTFTKSSGSITQTVNFVVNNNATLDFGTNVLDNAGSFTLNAGAKIITSHPNGLNSSGAAGTIQSTGTKTFNGGADYEFRGATTGNFTTTTSGGNGARDLIINYTGGEMTMGTSFTVSRNLTLTNGYLTPGSNTLLLTTAAGSTSANGAYVNGSMQKQYNNNSLFTFYVGKTAGGGLRPISLNTNSGGGTSTFTAEFMRGNATTDISNVLGSGIARVSSCEYWTLDRTGGRGGVVTIGWGASSNCTSATNYVTNLPTLRVARYNGASWEDAGGVLVGGSTLAEGSISTGNVTSFSPFALASSNISDNPLPVLFDGVKAYGKNDGVQIEWSNLTERDIVHYEVERSANGFDFYTINQQLPKSNRDDKASYTHFDASPVDGANFYRIRVDEIGGKPVYSKILRVEMGTTKAASFMLYPNPVVGKQLTISLAGVKQGKYNLEVFNTAGQRVYSTNVNNVGAGVTQMIELPATLKTGVYVTVVSGDNYRESKQFILK